MKRKQTIKSGKRQRGYEGQRFPSNLDGVWSKKDVIDDDGGLLE